jgi:glycosyltransferase 2 family protein
MNLKDTKTFRFAWLKSLLLTFVTGIIFIYLFSRIQLQSIWETYIQANGLFMSSAVIVSLFANLLAGPYIWGLILKFMKYEVPVKNLAYSVIASGPVRSILPLKSGEILKAIYLQKKFNIPWEEALGSCVFDKFTNLLGLLLLIGVTACICGKVYIGVTAVMLFAASLIFLHFIRHVRIETPLFFNYPKPRMIISGLARAFREISFFQRGIIILVSALFQLTHVFNTYLIFRALGIEVPLMGVLLFVPFIVFVTNVPVTIAGLGTREAAFMFFFYAYAGPHKLLSAGLLLSAIEYLLPIGIGCFGVRRFLREMI